MRVEEKEVIGTHLVVLNDFPPFELIIPNHRKKHNPSSCQKSPVGCQSLTKEMMKKIIDAITSNKLDGFSDELTSNCMWID